MHILLATVGTRGDVQPYLALALGLKRAGHEVTVAGHREHGPFVTSRGVAFRDAGSSMREVLESDLGRAWIESSDSIVRYAKTFRRVGEVMWPEQLRAGESMTEGVDAVILHPFALAAMHYAEARRLPAIAAPLVPAFPSRLAPPVFFPGAPAWGWLRGAINEASSRLIYKPAETLHEAHRRKLGLGPLGPNMIRSLHDAGVPFVHLYSAHLSPRPSDWPDDVGVAGFCFLDAPGPWSPPERLVRFLEAGAPPIYVGFGSMTGRDPEELARTTVAAVTRAGVRAVVVSGWGGLGSLDAGERILQLEEAPHDWLFPRVSAVVHHGGAGTLAASLRAGRPTVVAAFFGDQPYWGEMAAQLGAAPPPLARRSIDAEHLASAIRSVVTTGAYATAAARVREALAAEDGTALAVAQIERHLQRPRTRFWRRTPSS